MRRFWTLLAREIWKSPGYQIHVWADGAKGPARVDSLLLGKNADQFGAYGVGRVRSLADFWKHVELDYEKKTVGNWQK